MPLYLVLLYLLNKQTMKIYSQRDPRWSKVKLGFSKRLTIGSHGCYLTSLSMMVEKRPDKVNQILKEAKAFSGPNIISKKAAAALGLLYFGLERDINEPPDWYPNIKKVDFSPHKGIQSHFVLRIFENGRKKIVDPWTGCKERINYYPFVSYRLFKIPDQVKKVEVKNEDVITNGYIVKKGDSLWKISQAFYGEGRYWKKIYNANIDKIGDDPNLLKVNTVLTIPAFD